MFPRIALFIFLAILVGQIPGYSVSGGLFRSKNPGKPSSSADKDNKKNYDPVEDAVQRFYGRKPSSSANKHDEQNYDVEAVHQVFYGRRPSSRENPAEPISSENKNYNPVPEVQELLYGLDSEQPIRDYRETIKYAGELHALLLDRKMEYAIMSLLSEISHLGNLEEQFRQKAGIQCNYENLKHLMNTRRMMNKGSGRNEFTGEPAKHRLNKMINDLTDVLFESCSKYYNDKIKKFRFTVHKDKAKNDVRYALINLDRFQKFLKLPKKPVIFEYSYVPYSFISLNYGLIDVNTKLEPDDLQFIGVPQENTLSRNELLKRLIERTCGKIKEDESIWLVLLLGEQYVYYAREVYKQTGKKYFFRSEFGYFDTCEDVSSKMLMPEKMIS